MSNPLLGKIKMKNIIIIIIVTNFLKYFIYRENNSCQLNYMYEDVDL